LFDKLKIKLTNEIVIAPETSRFGVISETFPKLKHNSYGKDSKEIK
jgi:hypothetical protein